MVERCLSGLVPYKTLGLILIISWISACEAADQSHSRNKEVAASATVLLAEQNPEVDNPDHTPEAVRGAGKIVADGDLKWKEFTFGIGGVGRQASLPINHPPVVHAQLANHMRDEDHVVGVIAGEFKRAYPWWVVSNGHVVNDMIGGRPVFVAVCEACSGISAFYTEIDKMPLDFRMHGLQKGTWFASDHQTGSFWHPFTGKAWRGPLEGRRLERLQTFQSRWRDWKRDHPNSSVVLGSEEQRRREHSVKKGSGEPHYPNSPGGLDPKDLRPDRRNPRRTLIPKDEILFGIISEDGSSGKAYQLSKIREAGGLIRDQFEGREVMILLQGEFQVGAFSLPKGLDSRRFKVVASDPVEIQDQSGGRWNLWGQPLASSPEQTRLTPADGYLVEWYEWLYTFPDSELYGS